MNDEKTADTEPRRNCGAINAQSVSYQFEAGTCAEYSGMDIGWNVIYPSADDSDIEECRRIIDNACDAEAPEDDADEQAWRDAANRALDVARENGEHDPMMSYAWPVPGLTADSEAALRVHLDGECMTLITIDGEPYLALTGGGMDLSWSIARTYLALGYWPPARIDLPNQGEFDEKTWRAVCESKRIAIRWLTGSLESLESRFASEVSP